MGWLPWERSLKGLAGEERNPLLAGQKLDVDVMALVLGDREAAGRGPADEDVDHLPLPVGPALDGHLAAAAGAPARLAGRFHPRPPEDPRRRRPRPSTWPTASTASLFQSGPLRGADFSCRFT
jgi:hypothetical protein